MKFILLQIMFLCHILQLSLIQIPQIHSLIFLWNFERFYVQIINTSWYDSFAHDEARFIEILHTEPSVPTASIMQLIILQHNFICITDSHIWIKFSNTFLNSQYLMYSWVHEYFIFLINGILFILYFSRFLINIFILNMHLEIHPSFEIFLAQLFNSSYMGHLLVSLLSQL